MYEGFRKSEDLSLTNLWRNVILHVLGDVGEKIMIILIHDIRLESTFILNGVHAVILICHIFFSLFHILAAEKLAIVIGFHLFGTEFLVRLWTSVWT